MKRYVNVLVTSKHPRPQWLTMEQAVKHCTQGVGIWEWASTDQNAEPDIVMACCGDTPTLETLAAVTILRDAIARRVFHTITSAWHLQTPGACSYGLVCWEQAHSTEKVTGITVRWSLVYPAAFLCYLSVAKQYQ